MADTDALAALLARAFDHDPTMNWVFPDARRREDGLRLLFAANLRHARRHGRVDVRDHAVAVWLGPGAYPLRILQAFLSGHALLPFRISLGSLGRLRRLAAYAQMQHQRAVAGPHWYLYGIGVEPAAQRRGLGTELLQAGLERVDRDRLPCYLETSRESALPFYARFGFRVAIPGRLPPDGPPVFSLLRPAPAKRAPSRHP